MSDDFYVKKMEEAKKQGKDYVVYNYAQFKAKFAQCVHCDWVEYLCEDWEDDEETTSSLFTHTIKSHREGKDYLDGSE